MNSNPNPSGDLAPYLFHQGTNYRAYEYMGAHRLPDGYVFRVWAPNADCVRLVGDFNGWEGQAMTRISDMGIWECRVESDGLEGARYKYAISSFAGEHYKADPYAAYGETLKKTASIVWTKEDYDWQDGPWLAERRKIASGEHFWEAPMNVYEVHLASWRTRDGKTTAEGENYLNYREIADQLVPYVKRMGYTHVELLPIAEFPYDGSWGYQSCSYFAPTSRFGNPDDFRYFVDKLHRNGVGVILDWVPAHFPKDEHGLREFDGSPLYEYQGWDRMEHKEWGTRCFDVGRNEVQCFLISSAMSWLDRYHLDGLRVDAVASMLYLDYARKPGEWVPNVYGDNKNLEAIAFFKKLNTALFGSFPDILMIAEESTAWAAITKPVHEGGLGFNFKWNMGWANDLYEYVGIDPVFRRYHHKALNFSMSYAFSENYILPVSHDEVVHGKKSLIDKMWGNYDQKFAGMRAFLLWQMTHPGKKMTFMGCEFAQFREWDYENQLEWFMLDYPKHAAMQRYSAALNHFYLSHKELWQIDFSWEGFEWIYADRADDNLIAFRRMDRAGSELVVVINFSAAPYRGYGIPVKGEAYRVVLSTEDADFGGNGISYPDAFERNEFGMITPDLSPLSGLILEPAPKRKGRAAKKAAVTKDLPTDAGQTGAADAKKKPAGSKKAAGGPKKGASGAKSGSDGPKKGASGAKSGSDGSKKGASGTKSGSDGPKKGASGGKKPSGSAKKAKSGEK